MKFDLKKYAAVWAILFAVFNAICFITPGEAGGMSKYGGAFWAGYIFITLAFIGQLACTYIAFRGDTVKKAVFNFPILSISIVGLVLMLLFGSAAMAIPNLPNWIGILPCLLVLAFTAIAVIKAQSAVDAVEQLDKKVKGKTLFIRALTADAEALMRSAEGDEIKAEAKKVYESIRYSDPMSDDALAASEAELNEAFMQFKEAVSSGSAELAKSSAKAVISAAEARNIKCRLLK